MAEIGVLFKNRKYLVCVLAAKCGQRCALRHYVTMRKVKSCCYKQERYDVGNRNSLRPFEIRGDGAEKNLGGWPKKGGDHSIESVVESLLLTKIPFE